MDPQTQKEVERLRTGITNLTHENIRLEARVATLEKEVTKTVLDVEQIKEDISSINKILHQLYYVCMGAIIYAVDAEIGVVEMLKKVML